MNSTGLKHSQNYPGNGSASSHAGSDLAEHHPAKALLAGFVGGLVGTIMMTQFQNAWSKASKKLKNGNHQQQDSERGQDSGKEVENEDATMKAAGKLAVLAGHGLSHTQKKKLGLVVHYAFGTLQGGLYGMAVELMNSQGGLVAGLAFGAFLFAGADELVVPLLGLSDKPAESPVSSHLYGFGSHLIYGLTTEITRRGLRAALD